MLFSRYVAGLGDGFRIIPGASYTETPGWTWQRIETAYKAAVDALVARAQATRDAFRSGGLGPITACPKRGFSCVNIQGESTYTNILAKGLTSDFFNILWPLGVYMTAIGMPLTTDEQLTVVKQGSLTKTFVPSPDQQAFAAHLFYAQSQAITDGLLTKHWYEWGGINEDSSINEILDHSGYLATTVNGFIFNPPPPSNDELTKSGGYKAWRNRGGWLIDKRLVTGQAPIARGMMTNRSVAYCMCSGGYITGYSEYDKSSLISLEQTYVYADRANWSVKLAHVDADGVLGPAGDAVAGAFVTTLDTLHSAICAAAPILTAVDQKILAPDLCTNTKTKKSCNRGEKDCTCVPAPDTQKIAVNAGNMILNYWCSKPTATPPQPTAPLPPPPPQPASFPWGWVLAGGAALVAFKLSRK